MQTTKRLRSSATEGSEDQYEGFPQPKRLRTTTLDPHQPRQNRPDTPEVLPSSTEHTAPQSLVNSTLSGRSTKNSTRVNHYFTHSKSVEEKALHGALTSAHAEIDRMKISIAAQEKRHANRQLEIRQDMLLDILKEQERRQKAELDLDRMRRHCARLAEYYRARTKLLEEQKEAECAKRATAIADAIACREGLEHLQAVTMTLEEDLDELRQLENEAASRRKEDARGLPPAYGSLDDETRLPPYEIHKDRGTLDVALIKQEVRVEFEKAVAAIETRASRLRDGNSTEQASVGSETFRLITQALADCCAHVRVAIAHASDVKVTHHQLFDVYAGNKRRRRITRESGCPSFVAARLVRIIIDLTWSAISYLNLRPSTITLGGSERARAALQYLQIDEDMLSALKMTCQERKSMLELQNYLTQLLSLHTQLHKFRSGTMHPFFLKSTRWLSEQVDKQKELMANEYGMKELMENESAISSEAEASARTSR